MRILGFTSHRSEELSEPLESQGHKVIKLSGSKLSDLKWLLCHFRRSVLDYCPDAIVVNSIGVVGLFIIFYSTILDIPVYIRVSGYFPSGENLRPISQKSQLGYFCRHLKALSIFIYCVSWLINELGILLADGLLPVSNDLESRLAQKRVITDQTISVVPVPKTLHPQPAQPSFESDIVILTVTNLRFKEKYQGVIDIIGELQPLLESSGIKYRVAGGGTYLDPLREYVAEQRYTTNSVTILGHVDDIYDEYMDADLLIYISYLDGYPNVVLEGQGAGLPVITNRRFGMVEQIDDGYSGILLSQVSELRSEVHKLQREPDYAKQLGKNARNVVAKRNCPFNIGGQIEQAISGSIDGLEGHS